MRIRLRFADEELGLTGNKVLMARIISRLTPAPLFDLYITIVISYTSPIGLGPILTPSSSVVIALVLMVIIPPLPIILDARRGNVDLDVSERTMRAKFFIFAIGCYSVASFVYWILACHVMAVLAMAYATVTIGIMAATFRTKVSVHCAGVGGPGTAIIIVYGALGLLVVPVWIAVVWSRQVLHQHTLVQSVGGLTIAIVITIITYFVFW